MKATIPFFFFLASFLYLNPCVAQTNINLQDAYWRDPNWGIITLAEGEQGVVQQTLTLRLILDNEGYKNLVAAFPITIQWYRVNTVGSTLLHIEKFNAIDYVPRDFQKSGSGVSACRVSMAETKDFFGKGTFEVVLLDKNGQRIAFSLLNKPLNSVAISLY